MRWKEAMMVVCALWCGLASTPVVADDAADTDAAALCSAWAAFVVEMENIDDCPTLAAGFQQLVNDQHTRMGALSKANEDASCRADFERVTQSTSMCGHDPDMADALFQLDQHIQEASWQAMSPAERADDAITTMALALRNAPVDSREGCVSRQSPLRDTLTIPDGDLAATVCLKQDGERYAIWTPGEEGTWCAVGQVGDDNLPEVHQVDTTTACTLAP